MRDLLRTNPKQMELQNELYDEWKKALRQYWFSLDCKKAVVGTSNEVLLLSSKCERLVGSWPGHFMDVGSIRHLMCRLLCAEQQKKSIQYHQKNKVECISSAKQSFLEYSLETP